jgi:hypothetical protein
MTGRRRVGIYDRFNEARREKLAAMTPEQRKLHQEVEKRKKLLPVSCAPVKGNPEAIDWEYHECGYVPLPGRNGKPRPKSGLHAEPAWQWTEEKGTSGKPSMRAAIDALAGKVYRVGHRHNRVELHQEGGFPDDLFWGPYGPQLIIRELKAMRPDWKRGQKQHLLSLQEAGLNVDVWFPCCVLSGRVDEELAELAGVAPKGTYARRERGVPNQPLTWEDIADGAFDSVD